MCNGQTMGYVMMIAIIPARGGSKRIPGKNTRVFAGKPLINYAIDAAKKADMFDKIMVSTDSPQIAEVSLKSGAEVPFLRPAELADDYTPTVPVLKHAVNWLVSNSIQVESFCCIYSNPFVTADNLKKGYALLREKNANSVMPVATFPFPIFRGVKINESGRVEFIFPEHALARSQDLPEAYHDAGQFYWWKGDFFIETEEIRQLHHLKQYPLIIPRYGVQDIDTPEDWEVAEKLYQSFFK